MDAISKVVIIVLSFFAIFGGIIAVIIGYQDWKRAREK